MVFGSGLARIDPQAAARSSGAAEARRREGEPALAGASSRATRRLRRRLRVCQFTPILASGGSEERIARILAGLGREDFDLTWMGFGEIQHGIRERVGADVMMVPFARDPTRGIEFGLILRIAAELARIRPDVVHTHNWSTSLYAIVAARLAGVPAVIYGDGGRDSAGGPSRRRRALMRALAPHVDGFTTVCEFLAREIVETWRVPRARVSVIPNGVDLARFEAAPPREVARRQLGLADDALVVASLSGRFRPVKRLPELIDAAGAAAASRPGLRLVLVGDPIGREAELRARAQASGLGDRLHLVGHVPRVETVLRAFDVVVNCSAFEGMSNAMIEAMSAGVPVVATAVGGTPELITDRRNGLLVPPGDVTALARAIGELADAPALRTALGTEGRRRMASEHGQAEMLERHRELYAVLGARGRARVPTRLLRDFGKSIARFAGTFARAEP